MKILLVEDEVGISSFVKLGLEEEGYDVDAAYDGQMAEGLLRSFLYDVIILDIMVPKINGLKLCRKIREKNQRVPIIILSALGETNDVVNGLDLGANDYVKKPFHLDELKARVRAHLKRYSTEDLPLNNDILKIDDLEWDPESRSIKRGEKDIHLTTREYKLFEVLFKNKGKVLNRSFLAENVWNINFDTQTNVVDVYVNYLRNKIDKDFDKKLIHTIKGYGYVLK